MTKDTNPVPLVDRLAYVLREYEEAHATWQPLVINGRAADLDGKPFAKVKTECECQQCRDARVVLADYDKQVEKHAD